MHKTTDFLGYRLKGKKRPSQYLENQIAASEIHESYGWDKT